MGKKQKIVKPPQLPPDVPDDEIEVFDEDLDFVVQNRQYAFVSRLDTRAIKLGRAEPIYVTTCPRDPGTKEGTIINITTVSENGIFLSGSKHGHVRNLKFINMDIKYRRWTDYPGGLVDYRPGYQGLVKHSTAGIIMEHMDGFEIKNVNMRWSKDGSRDWDDPL